MRTTHLVLAAAHMNRDTAHNAGLNVTAWCKWYPPEHGRPEHNRRRGLTLFRRGALGDPFGVLTGLLFLSRFRWPRYPWLPPCSGLTTSPAQNISQVSAPGPVTALSFGPDLPL